MLAMPTIVHWRDDRSERHDRETPIDHRPITMTGGDRFKVTRSPRADGQDDAMPGPDIVFIAAMT